MVSGVITWTLSSCQASTFIRHKERKHCPELKSRYWRWLSIKSQFSNSNPKVHAVTEKIENDAPMTGAAFDFFSATTSLTEKLLESPKKVTLVRHGLSSWNEESRVQGSSNLSVLTETGVKQAERCRQALSNLYFDQCFSSPISRAKSTAEVIWQGREQPLVFLDSLKEAHLFFLEGMKNGPNAIDHVELGSVKSMIWYCLHHLLGKKLRCIATDARKIYPKEYTQWREDPANFSVNGVYPVWRLWDTAREAWKEILYTPGKDFLVVTHKSMLRALICTALGLEPERFRAIDINNGGISVFNFNTKGEAMLQSLNMTAHMYSDYLYL